MRPTEPTLWRPLAVASVGLLALTAACAPPDPYPDSLDLLPPVASEQSLVYGEQTTQSLLFALPGDDAVAFSRRQIGDERTTILWTTPTVSGNAVLALTAPASDKEEDVGERLHVLPADGESDGQEYEVLAPFSSVSLSPDGRRAVLHFGDGVGSGALQNANQVAIVDLAGTEVRNLTLNGFGGRVATVDFPVAGPDGSTAVNVGDRTLELVAFLAEGEVVLVDAANEQTDQVAVRFGDAINFSPVESLLRPGNDLFGRSVLFLRSNIGSDVAMLSLVDKADEQTGEPGFSAQVSLLPVANGASDMATYDGEQAPYLVTTNGSGFVFTNIETQGNFTVATGGQVQQLWLRDANLDTTPTRQAVGWAYGGNALFTLELDTIEQALGQSPRRLNIETGIDELVVLDNDRVLVSSGSNLYVVDIPLEQVTPLSAAAPYDARSSALDGDRLLLGTPGQSWVSTVDLITLNPESMVLDDPIGQFFYLPASDKLVMTHNELVGHVTVADATNPSRSTSYVAWGYLLDGVLDP